MVCETDFIGRLNFTTTTVSPQYLFSHNGPARHSTIALAQLHHER